MSRSKTRRPAGWEKAVAKAKKGRWDPRWIRDVQDVRAVLDGCWFDPDAADHVVEFFHKFLRHSKGRWAGKPFILEPWEEDAVRRLFGWKREDGTRRYRRGGFWVPKKNGKSTLAAGIELYLLVADGEAGAEVYTLANDRGQAGIIYREAEQMVLKSPDLRKRLKPVPSTKTIAYLGMAALLQALSSDVPTKEGLNAHGVVFDEIHAAKKRDLWDTMEYSGAARQQPMQLSFSTAGIYDPTSIGWEEYQKAKKVADGTLIDWAFFALIYEAGPKDDWTDPKVWAKANPNFGVTIDPKTFAAECQAAQESPAKQNSFRRYRLNQWVQQATRAIDLQVWDQNSKGHDEPMTLEDGRGRQCDAALDLSSVSDLCSFTATFECLEDPEALDVFTQFWVPEAQLEPDRPGKKNKNPNRDLYQQWADAGLLKVTPGNVIDYDTIIEDVLDFASTFVIRDMNIDRLFQGQHVYNKLAEEGLNVFPMGQGYMSMGPPMREFHRRLLARQLHHGQHPILRWMADNVVTTKDAHDNEKIDKQKSAQKVDGIVTLVMSLDRNMRYGAGEPESVYDEEDLFVL